MRHAGPATLAAQCTSAQTCHLRRKSGLVDKDQPFRIQIELPIEPGAPALQDIRPVLLQCMCGLFLNVQPRPRSHAPTALRLILTRRSADKSTTISSSVTSLRSSISSRTNASCASSIDGRLQPCGRELGSPSFALAIQRIAVETPTSKRAAACRADMPEADAFNNRNRRSSVSGVLRPPSGSRHD